MIPHHEGQRAAVTTYHELSITLFELRQITQLVERPNGCLEPQSAAILPS